jgi:hypothetical protein
MAYDENLATRVREALAGRRGIDERRMFGGLAYLLNGHMCLGVLDDNLVVRIGADHYEKALAERHVRPMDFTGRPLRGFIYVSASGIRGAVLAAWIERGLRYARSLPAKGGAKRTRRKETTRSAGVRAR